MNLLTLLLSLLNYHFEELPRPLSPSLCSCSCWFQIVRAHFQPNFAAEPKHSSCLTCAPPKRRPLH
jgi:hypothetical protein